MVQPGDTVERDAVPQLLSAYRAVPGVADELFGADGRIRPVWNGFLSSLAAIGPDELEARKARGDRYLRDAGVFYRQYGPQDSYERDWPLSHMPVLLDEAGPALEAIALAANGAEVATGIQRWQDGRWYNALIRLDADGNLGGVYDKHHLVPFGEYIPFGRLLKQVGITALACSISGRPSTA